MKNKHMLSQESNVWMLVLVRYYTLYLIASYVPYTAPRKKTQH